MDSSIDHGGAGCAHNRIISQYAGTQRKRTTGIQILFNQSTIELKP